MKNLARSFGRWFGNRVQHKNGWCGEYRGSFGEGAGFVLFDGRESTMVVALEDLKKIHVPGQRERKHKNSRAKHTKRR